MPADKIQNLRDAMAAFDSPEQALRVLAGLRTEKAHSDHAQRVHQHGRVSITGWGQVEAYMNERPTRTSPQIDLRYASAQLKVAIAQRDDQAVWNILWTIAKAVKPEHLYER